MKRVITVTSFLLIVCANLFAQYSNVAQYPLIIEQKMTKIT
jgi:hypothetical protein